MGHPADLFPAGDSLILCPANNCSGYGKRWKVSESDHEMLFLGSEFSSRISADGRFIVTKTAKWADLGLTAEYSSTSWCESLTCQRWLARTSDFAAGAGDFISFDRTKVYREKHGINVVNEHSGSYLAGTVTGAGVVAAGSALGAGKVVAGLETKIAIHGAHHAFRVFGWVRYLPHLQIMW